MLQLTISFQYFTQDWFKLSSDLYREEQGIIMGAVSCAVPHFKEPKGNNHYNSVLWTILSTILTSSCYKASDAFWERWWWNYYLMCYKSKWIGSLTCRFMLTTLVSVNCLLFRYWLGIKKYIFFNLCDVKYANRKFSLCILDPRITACKIKTISLNG